jgi:hypothetical protein
LRACAEAWAEAGSNPEAAEEKCATLLDKSSLALKDVPSSAWEKLRGRLPELGVMERKAATTLLALTAYDSDFATFLRYLREGPPDLSVRCICQLSRWRRWLHCAIYAEELRRLLGSADKAVAIEAAKALAMVGDPRGVPYLIEALFTPGNHARVGSALDQVFIRLPFDLRGNGQDPGGEVLEERYVDYYREWWKKHGSKYPSILFTNRLDLLRRLLRDPDGDVRMQAVRSCTLNTAQVLYEVLESREADSALKDSACERLANFRKPAAVPVLMRLIVSGDENEKKSAARCLSACLFSPPEGQGADHEVKYWERWVFLHARYLPELENLRREELAKELLTNYAAEARRDAAKGMQFLPVRFDLNTPQVWRPEEGEGMDDRVVMTTVLGAYAEEREKEVKEAYLGLLGRLGAVLALADLLRAEKDPEYAQWMAAALDRAYAGDRRCYVEDFGPQTIEYIHRPKPLLEAAEWWRRNRASYGRKGPFPGDREPTNPFVDPPRRP